MVEDVNLGGESTAVDDPFEDVGQPEEPVFKDVSEGPEEERLGGEDTEPEDVGMPAEPAEVEESEESVADEVAEVAAALGADDESVEDSEVSVAPEPLTEPEPEPEPKNKAARRTYLVLEETASGENPEFKQQMTVEAHNAETALKRAFETLVDEDSVASLTLCVIPERFWRWRTVEGRVKTTSTIEIR